MFNVQKQILKAEKKIKEHVFFTVLIPTLALKEIL